MLSGLPLLSRVSGLPLLSRISGLGLIDRRRLDLGGLVDPPMIAVMTKRQEDATLQVLDRAVELGPTTRCSSREPTGDILR
jgi:hypothetical protein